VTTGAWRRVAKLVCRGFFATRFTGAQYVEADASDDGGEPASEIFDTGSVGAVETQPRFLHSVVGFAEGAEHPVGDASQVSTVFFELLGEAVWRDWLHRQSCVFVGYVGRGVFSKEGERV
jgi:hypothetical protein